MKHNYFAMFMPYHIYTQLHSQNISRPFSKFVRFDRLQWNLQRIESVILQILYLLLYFSHLLVHPLDLPTHALHALEALATAPGIGPVKVIQHVFPGSQKAVVPTFQFAALILVVPEISYDWIHILVNRKQHYQGDNRVEILALHFCFLLSNYYFNSKIYISG